MLVKPTLWRTASEIPRTDFPDQIATKALVIFGNTTLTGIVREVAESRPFVQGQNGIGRQGTKAHCRDVEQRCTVGHLTVFTPHLDP